MNAGKALVESLLTHLVEVDDWLPELVLHLVEVTHTDLSEVSRVVLVHVGAVVVLTTGKTATTGMLPVLADTTVSGRDVASQLASLGGVGWHFGDVWLSKSPDSLQKEVEVGVANLCAAARIGGAQPTISRRSRALVTLSG